MTNSISLDGPDAVTDPAKDSESEEGNPQPMEVEKEGKNDNNIDVIDLPNGR